MGGGSGGSSVRISYAAFDNLCLHSSSDFWFEKLATDMCHLAHRMVPHIWAFHVLVCYAAIDGDSSENGVEGRLYGEWNSRVNFPYYSRHYFGELESYTFVFETSLVISGCRHACVAFLCHRLREIETVLPSLLLW